MITRALLGLLLGLIASTAWSQNAVRGGQLYNTKLNPAYLSCSDPNVCHGADPNGNLRNIKRGTSGAVILAAVNTQDLMKALIGFVNATDAADLAAYIVNPAAANGPQITLNGTTLSFASTQTGVGNSAPTPASVLLTNSGSSALTITGIAKTGANAAEFTATGTCVGASVTVAAGATCTLSATFTPMAAGTRTATFTFQSNAATNPAITLTGTASAVATPSIARSVMAITFNTQTVGTTSAARQVVITNNGTLPVSITAAFATPTSEFGSTGTCVGNLAPGANCAMNVTFTPAVTGTRSGNLMITSNAPGSPHAVTLSGPGVTTPVGAATLAASALSFPATAIGAPAAAQRTTLTNTGNAVLTISSLQIGGMHASDFKMSAASTCAAGTMAVDATCQIEAEFKPQSAGTKSADVVVAHSAGTAAVALAGTGDAAAAPVGPTAASSSALVPSNVGGGGAFDLWHLAVLVLLPLTIRRLGRQRARSVSR